MVVAESPPAQCAAQFFVVTRRAFPQFHYAPYPIRLFSYRVALFSEHWMSLISIGHVVGKVIQHRSGRIARRGANVAQKVFNCGRNTARLRRS
jgi:hypothetical protein